MFITGIIVQHSVAKPQDISTVIFLGYSMINRLFRIIMFTFLLSVLILYLYIDNLHKLIACENDVFRIRRYCRKFQLLLFFIGIISVAQIIITFIDIANAKDISCAYILHSKIFGYFGCLFFSIWFLAITYKHIRTIRNIPSSVLVAAKGKKDECG